MKLHEPASVEEACRLLRADPFGTMALSGGTALVLLLRQGFIEPDELVSLRAIDELRGVEQGDGLLRIGAGETLHDVSVSPLVRSLAPALAAACAEVGNVRVRNVATIGGNLAESDYSSDPPAVLASLDAVCRIQGADGERTVPVRDFITGFFENVLDEGEVVTGVEVPVVPARREVYLKYRTRSSEDRACVGVAAAATFEEGIVAALEVVIGAVAPTLQRHAEAAGWALGSALDDGVIERIAAAYAERTEPMDDARGSAWYRRRMIQVFVRRALRGLRETDSAPEGVH